MTLHYNEEELQWEGVVAFQGKDLDVVICNDYEKDEIDTVVAEVISRLGVSWAEILASVTVEFLGTVNNRRRFLKLEELNAEAYTRALTCDSLFIMEEMACELVFDDQGISQNSMIVVYVDNANNIRPPEIDDWEEERQIRGERVRVSVCNDFQPENIEKIIREIEASINELWPDVENVIAQHLLPLYNEKWRLADSAKLSRKEFLACMQLSAVYIMEDKAFDLYFLDNDLFGGHYIELFVDSDGSLYEPSLYR